MSPIATETPIATDLNLSLKDPNPKSNPKPQWFSQTGRPDSEYPYKAFLPTWTAETYPPLTEFEHVDPGLAAKDHVNPRAFLSHAEVEEITPRFGSVISGIQLTNLDTDGRQQLALQFSRRIVGLKEEESSAILDLLYDHIEKGSDFQIRINWKPRTVVLWDNRITAHNANVDFDDLGYRRHGPRITPQAERPFL
ncbi:hypothetical protein CspHIS471_0200910 [Cutaneotrichosporon sp. HIS471]|nr:hypothetical protein CspHIS471_0200910 [Cutaneotrichosporon sp. HIS471]